MPGKKTSASRSSSTDSEHISTKHVKVTDPNGQKVSNPSVFKSGKVSKKAEGDKKAAGGDKFLAVKKTVAQNVSRAYRAHTESAPANVPGI
ncbi:hypothetical protein BHYA_0077g00230 [Botrytis hyacinthi]|uniref:Uncharacterized protein n=1 Tax=Botrytis hyacinthi TaxID=278943 RepID=A0A4Z1GSZ7_9HELO|nr:hypothetical protein BHYA_0077g00230 [Botrytis hyacinthi]